MKRELVALLSLICLTHSPLTHASDVSYPLSSNATLSPLGEQKTIIIMFNFQDDPTNQPFTREQVYQAYFGESQSVNAFYKENSQNLTWLTGVVVGWYTVPYDLNYSGCQVDQRLAEQAARRDGINLDNYPRWIFLHAPRPNCFGSSASTGGNPSYSLINNTLNLKILSHEYGHNLGIGHADALNCGVKIIDHYGNCQRDYYLDWFSVMGSDLVHLSAFHKEYLGFLNSPRIQEVTHTDNYSILPYLSTKIGIKSLKILRQSSNDYFYLDYRRPQPQTFDQNLAGTPSSGAMIHIGFITCDYNGGCAHETYLLDASPASTNYYFDSAMTDNQVVSDEINLIRITQLFHTDSEVRLRIELPGIDFTNDNKTDFKEVQFLTNVFDGLHYFYNRYHPNHSGIFDLFDYHSIVIDYGWQW